MSAQVYEGRIFPVPRTKKEKIAFLSDVVHPLYASARPSLLPYHEPEWKNISWEITETYFFSPEEFRLEYFQRQRQYYKIRVAGFNGFEFYCLWRIKEQTICSRFSLIDLARAVAFLEEKLQPNGLTAMLNATPDLGEK